MRDAGHHGGEREKWVEREWEPGLCRDGGVWVYGGVSFYELTIQMVILILKYIVYVVSCH